MSFRSLRYLATSSRRFVKKIQESIEGEVTTVSLVDVPEPSNVAYYKGWDHMHQRRRLQSQIKPVCQCCLCRLPTKLSYSDVLILEQFMRVDGSVFPMEFTGVCVEQQERLERCVMQAHWSGLFPDKTIPNFDRSGWKRLNRHWRDDDRSMLEPELKLLPGNWFYINRYNPRASLWKPGQLPEVISKSRKRRVNKRPA
uniref:Mitochondrial ribosomal protein S18A n=1 Tax=Ditylenchus dipsaci TaxID=166011 RepID=A0A915ECW7_9BILA